MVTLVVTEGLSRFSLEVLRERARLALRDPAGEVDAVAPLTREQAAYLWVAADTALFKRRETRPAVHPSATTLAEALNLPYDLTTGYINCPSHEDTSGDLHFTWKGDKLLLHCFAGCTFDEIRAAV